MAFLPKGKAKSGPKKQFTDEGDLFAIEFDKAKSFAMQNAQRITEVGKSFAKSFVNFQTTFDKNTKDFAIQQKASFREREEELVKTFSDGPLTEGELLQSFEKLKQYMDDADVSIQEFTGRMESGGAELKKTFDSITDGIEYQEKKQRKLTQAGVATETKIIDGKVELVALTKDEIFKKQQLMHNLQKEIEVDDKELKRLSKRNDLTQEQMDRQVELIDNIENNNEEIRDIQAQGVKKLKGDLGLFGQFGRVLSDGYNEFRSSFDEKVNAFFPAPLAGIITGFVDSIQTVGGQLLDFAKPFIQTAKVLIAAPKVIGKFFSEGGGFQKGLQAFGKGMKTVVGGLKKFAVAILLPILGFVAIGIAIAAIVAAITYAVLKIKNKIDDLFGRSTVDEDDVGDSALQEKEDGSLETKEEAVERINTDIKENKKLADRSNVEKVAEDNEAIKERVAKGETALEDKIMTSEKVEQYGIMTDMMEGHSGATTGGSEQFYRPNGPEGPGIYSINRSTGKQNLLKSLEEIIEENSEQFKDYSRVVLDEETKGNYIKRKAKKVATSDIKEKAFEDEFKRREALKEVKDSSLEKDTKKEQPANVNINKVDSQQNSNAAVIKNNATPENSADSFREKASGLMF